MEDRPNYQKLDKQEIEQSGDVSVISISQATTAVFTDLYFQHTFLFFIQVGSKRVICPVNGELIANTTNGYRVLETSHPPVYYISQSDIQMAFLSQRADKQSMCEFKGMAVYWNLKVGEKASPMAAWSYPNPRPYFKPITDYLAFYASRVDACYVGDEKVQAQAGDFYGGWITEKIVGPFKGGPGTWGW